jgi:hypothetical protein
MSTTRHAVDVAATHQEHEALVGDAHAPDGEKGGRDEARSPAIRLWSHHWRKAATREGSEIIGTGDIRWGTRQCWWQSRPMQALGRLERHALGRVTPGDEPQEGYRRCTSHWNSGSC